MLSNVLIIVIGFAGICFGGGWQKTFGGFQDDYGYDIKTTPDNGFIVVGATFSYGSGSPTNPNIYVIRTNENGDTLWTKIIGGAGADYGYAITVTQDSGYAIAGYTNSAGAGNYDVYLIRLNSRGETVFTRTFGGYNDDFGYSIVETPDEGFIIVGTTRSFGAGGSDMYIIRTNSSGDTLWTKTIGGRNDEHGYSCVISRTGFIFAVGSTQSSGHGRDDVYVVKMGLNGTIIETNIIGGNQPDIGYSIDETADSFYIIGGYTESFGGTDRKAYLIKINDNCDSIWARLYGGPDDDIIQAVVATFDGGVAACGRTFNVSSSNYDLYFIRVNRNGELIWEKTYGGGGNDFGYGIDNTLDGAFVITGWTRSFGFGGWNLYIIKSAFVGYVVYDLRPGWNLLSLPFNITAEFELLFPYSTPPAYIYNTLTRRYEPITTISSGYGFWVLNWGDTTYSILDTTGIGSISDTLYPGWNLISGPSFAVPASELTTLSGVVPPVYGYNGRTYYPAETIIPGKGYWVLALRQIIYTLPRR